MTISVRRAEVTDSAAIAEIYRPYVTDGFATFELDAPSSEEIAGRIQSSIGWLVAEEDDAIHGYAYAAPFHERPAYRWSVEVSVYVAGNWKGGGVGRLLISSLLEGLRRRGFVNAFAGIALPNDVSIRLFESLGFRRVALHEKVGYKNGAWRHVGWWQLILNEPVVPPAEPLEQD